MCGDRALTELLEPKLSAAEMNALVPEHLKNAAVNSKEGQTDCAISGTFE
jgi:hypothetical protein